MDFSFLDITNVDVNEFSTFNFDFYYTSFVLLILFHFLIENIQKEELFDVTGTCKWTDTTERHRPLFLDISPF